jgi:long-chain fatty acid transport protein
LANSSLFDGRLLVALDAIYLMWDTADFWKSIYRNQWIMQLGGQYELNDRVKLRAGYVLAENPIDDNVGTTVGGVPVPGGVPAVKYTQAQFGVINENRMTIGCGVSDIISNVDLDLLAGAMFRESHQFGALTRINLESYWLGAGLTWKFGQ